MPPNSPLLLIYRDKPCVVIGRNQNPWKEINIGALKAANIPFVRRRSGGGTVYHVRITLCHISLIIDKIQDLGNTNFSLHMPRGSFERQKGSGLAVDALKRMGIAEAGVNERNDVCVGQFKIRSRLNYHLHNHI
jgi:lipoate-protein ligase A